MIFYLKFCLTKWQFWCIIESYEINERFLTISIKSKEQVMKKFIFSVVSRIFVCSFLLVILGGCGKNGPLGAFSAYMGIGYSSDKEIAESIEAKCLKLERYEDRGEFADFLQFEEGFYLHGSKNSHLYYKEGESYLIQVSPFFGKKGIMPSNELIGKAPPRSCRK